MVEFALRANGAAVRQHDVFGDGQPQSGAAGFAGAGFVDPVEALEQAIQMLGRNTGAKILNIEFDAVAISAGLPE